MPDLTTQLVTGDWSYVIADGFGSVDTDRDPDEVGPDGIVVFTPQIGPNAALPTGSPLRAVTIGLHRGLVANGELQDLNGERGIRLPTRIGTYPVYWTAQPLLTWKKAAIAADVVRFGPTSSPEIHLNAVLDPGAYPTLGDDMIRQIVEQWLTALGNSRYAALGSDGKLLPDLLPERGIVRYLGAVASQSAMLTLAGQDGDWCIRTDTGVHWVIIGSNPAQIASWKDIPLPASALTKPVADAAYGISAPGRRIPRRTTPITRFQAGHGWSAGGSLTAFDGNYTADPALGSQCFGVITKSDGTFAQVGKVGAAPINLSGKRFAVMVRVDNPAVLQSPISLYLGTGGFAAYTQLVVALPANLRPGEWTWCYCSWADVISSVGTVNRSAITDIQFLFGSVNGSATTVSLNALDTFDANAHFPGGVVTFGFDDTYASALTKAAPVLDAYGWSATEYLIVDQVGASAGQLSLTQLSTLADRHGWQMAAHCFSSAMHQAGVGMTGVPVADAETDMRSAQMWLRDHGFVTDQMAWPQGLSTAPLEAAAAKYFTTARGNSWTPAATLPPDRPMWRKTFAITAATTTGQIHAAVDAAAANGLWLDFVLHDVVDASPVGPQSTVATLTDTCAYVASKGIPVRLTSHVVDLLVAGGVSKSTADASYAPLWAAGKTYAVDDLALLPTGRIGRRKTAGTAAASFTDVEKATWSYPSRNFPGSGAPTLPIAGAEDGDTYTDRATTPPTIYDIAVS